MGLKPDRWIKHMALEQRMIEPFVDCQVRQGVISFGLRVRHLLRRPQGQVPAKHCSGKIVVGA